MQKFIVTSEGRLRWGDVNMHRDLLQRGEECIGGGMYEFDYVSSRMLLYGRSYDYGRVKWGWIDTLLVPESLRGLTMEYEEVPLTHFVDIKYIVE